MAQADSLTEGALAGSPEREVLNSHPRAAGPPWRRRASALLLALALLLPVGPAVPGALGPATPRTAPASHVASIAGTPSTPYDASLVALVRSRCPQVRRLWLGDVDTLLFVEIAPCYPDRQQRGSRTSGPGDEGSMRFARIVGGSPSAVGGQSNRWIAVRCPDRACTAPELEVALTQTASTLVH